MHFSSQKFSSCFNFHFLLSASRFFTNNEGPFIVNYFPKYRFHKCYRIFILATLHQIFMSETQYTEDNIRSLDWKEHIRMRPGMYIGKLGDGSSPDDGIYILLKEVIDNCIDEFVMGTGKTIEVRIKDKEVKVRDYGRGIPL